MSPPAPARRVALLAPMRPELRPLLRALSLRRLPDGEGRLFAGAVARVEIVATTTGIGIRAAARTTQRVLDSMPIDHVVVVGIAGGIGAGVAIGDLIVPELVVDLSSGAQHRPSRLGDVTPRGTLLTSDGLLVDPEAFARFERQGAVAVDMETSAVAAVCERRGCAWSVFRAISDRVGDRAVDAAVFGLAGPEGEGDLPAVLRLVVGKPWRIPQLIRLARDMRLAANAAAQAAVQALAAEPTPRASRP